MNNTMGASMKPSKMKKDKITSVRINVEILETVKKTHGSMQKFIDAKLDELLQVNVKTTITKKKGK